MKKNKKTGYPIWAQKSWWVVPDQSILIEYLKVLIGIKRNIPNIDARIHEVCTIIAYRYLSNSIFKNGKIIEEDINPSPRTGPDIKVKGRISNGKTYSYHAEVLTNFNFKEYAEAKKLYEDVNKLINSDVDRKILVVLFGNLVEKVKNRCKNRKKDPIDLDEKNIQVLSIEEIIKSKL